MYTELNQQLTGERLKKWKSLIKAAGLWEDEQIESTALVWDGEELVACGSRFGNVLKLITTNEERRGEDLTATVIGSLKQDAFDQGYDHLFLYTKPENELLFSSLFFYPVAKTSKISLLEDRKDGIKSFVADLPRHKGQKIAAIVMNANPFTKGHRHLAELAASECDFVYLFVLSEDRSEFSTADRLEMVRLGTADLSNVAILPTGPYLISAATFPTYFLKDRESAGSAQCLLDIEIFTKHFAPALSITHRYVGKEPLSPLTNAYNQTLKEQLPLSGITLHEIDRIESDSTPISAGAVRKLIRSQRLSELDNLLPASTLSYLKKKQMI